MNHQTARHIGITIVSVGFVLMICFAAWRILRPHELHVDVDRRLYPIAGIDLSAHNGVPDFDSIASAGIDFVYLKASEGVSFRDASFLRNYSQTRKYGLTVGAYHFFRFDCDGRGQAFNLMKAIEGCRLDMPLVIDIEEAGNPANHSTELIISRLETMVSYLKAYGYPVMIYTNKNGYTRFIKPAYEQTDSETGSGTELWICSFTNPPLPHRQWSMWQHSHKARVPGVKGNVDINTFNGDRSAWFSWLHSFRTAQ